MKNYIIYKKDTGKILRSGTCSTQNFNNQIIDTANETILEGKANDITQKIDVLSKTVIEKNQAEIDAEKPPETPIEDQQAQITNAQLQIILDRLTALESK